MAWVREGLQLDSWLCYFLPSVSFNDRSVNVFLQVNESPVVAHCQAGKYVWVFDEEGLPDSVCAHDVIHMHADCVFDFGRQGRCG